MVSQADKNGIEVNQSGALSPDGGHVIYGGFGGVPESTSGAQSWLLASRTASGWTSANLLPPAAVQPDENYQAAATSPDLESVLWSVGTGLGQAGLTPRLTLARVTSGNQSILETFPTFFGNSGAEFVASDDVAHVYGNVPVAIDTSQHQPGTSNVYDFGSGTPTLVSRMPTTDLAPQCGVEPNIGFATTSNRAMVSQHWTSTDGSKLFFATQGDNCSDPIELYERDLTTSTLVSGPVTSGTDQGLDLLLQAAADGSWVIYRTASALDPADTDTTADIYRYTAGSGNECLTCAATDPANVSTNVNGNPTIAAAVSEDGSHIYFNSQDQIDGQGVPGDNNIYVWRSGAIHYIAPSDGITPVPEDGGEVTPTGRFLLFSSSQPGLNTLTGTDNGGHVQVYRYDDQTGDVTCVSCPPSGGPATSDILGLVRAGQTILDRRGAMSDDGSIVAFVTSDALVPQHDVNQGPDIYEWHNGQVGLITSGTMVYGRATTSALVTVSPSGHDILFQDFDKLTQETQDDATKLFDARIDGGFPPPPTPPVPCDGEACLGLPSSSPSLLNPTSTTFTGAGNVKPLTRAQKLKKALRKCKSKRKLVQRKKCESSAKKSFGRSK